MSDFQIVIKQRFRSVLLIVWASFVPGIPLATLVTYYALRHDPSIATVATHPTTTIIGLLGGFAILCCIALRKLLFHPNHILATPTRDELENIMSKRHRSRLENTWGASPENYPDLLLGLLVKRYFQRLSLCWILGGVGLGFAIMLTMFSNQPIYLLAGAPIWAFTHFISRPKQKELQQFFVHLGAM